VPAWTALGLEGAAALDPHAVAVSDNAGSYSYGELLGRVGFASGLLASCGVEANATVLLLAPNRREAVVAYLAALRLGARVVALDRRAGKADVAHAVELTRPQLVLADPDLAELVCPPDLPVLGLREASAGSAELPPAADDRATVILFTSGTSSTPKAALHTMPSLLAGVRNMAHTLQFSRQDAPFLVSPLASITGVSQTHLALECGGSLLLEDAFSRVSSLRRLADLGATVFGGAPFVLEELLAAAIEERCSALPLRAVAVGGSAIPRPLLEDAYARFGIVPSRVYGSSECPIAFASAPADDLEARMRDEGIAMPGTQGRIDPANGELHVRGKNLFGGYLDPEHNRDAFTADAWFRTGDQATLTGGRLRITGRLKEVVARKGLKISLAEVDEAMNGMPGVAAAAAYALPDEHTGERLVLAIHVDPTAAVGLRDVTRWLAGRGLATWKLPEQIVVWDEPFPHTASGKVLRRALDEGGAGRPAHYGARLSERQVGRDND
jgi:acyl-CoA synthetase (AMP-forming)/AMP-acid ligase II